MKKLFFVFLFNILSILPCIAANWEQVDDQGKMFIDTTSIKKYNYKYNFGSEKGFYYSFWSKRLNKNDDAGKKLEKMAGYEHEEYGIKLNKLKKFPCHLN